MDKPPQIDPDNVNQIRYALYIALAAIAGFIGSLYRAMESRKKVVWSRTFIEAAASGFTGFLMLLLCDFLNFHENLTGVVVGTMGWLGATVTVRVLEKWINKKLGVDISLDNAPSLQERKDDGLDN